MLLSHSFVICISERNGGSDEISLTMTSTIVALAMDSDYNISKFIFKEKKINLLGKKKDLFLMYPRFLLIFFNEKYPQIETTPDTLDMEALGPNTCGLMKQSRKSTKVAYHGLKKLVKFGKFDEIEDSPAVSSINVKVVDEHMAPKPKFQFAFEDIELSYEEDQEDQEKELTENEFKDFVQQSISNPEKDAFVTPLVVSERESDTTMQSSIPIFEQMGALIAELQRTTRKPP
ncbi:unnamed protein product [Lactuca saligna]|uniref:Uncharacterized protein n=1 Tax=Lactuca saligna TaxID=75948 RepID=A0AA35ZRD1_LACSI|nr:unnamed protein product [Lactuca saligna]